MGIYLNPKNDKYKDLMNGLVFVDKSSLIECFNQKINTSDKYLCVSRPRRFGKTADADMLTAYYSSGCDSSSLFDSLQISQSKEYSKHLNKYHVIHLNMQDFLSLANSIDELIRLLTKLLVRELKDWFHYPEFMMEEYLSLCLKELYSNYDARFIFIIDEWDCVFREYKDNTEAQKKYLDFLRNLLKDQAYVSLVYMTGILPIKKYGTHSALNMFTEISMTSSKGLGEYMGFNEEEVINLCNQYHTDFNLLKQWYDGYHIEDTDVYNPRSIVGAITYRKLENYWSQTETYEALQFYIDLNYDGLKDAIVEMLEGNNVKIDTLSFQNDMTSFASKDDILTLLVHLGYLAYNQDTKEVHIPNKEIEETFYSSIKNSSWGPVSEAIRNSDDLLKATLKQDEERVAKYIEEAHLETSILTYNSEEALSYTLGLAYYTARNRYTIIREYPTGKGYADLVFIPKYDDPAMIIELKWNKDIETAITQIKENHYEYGLEQYQDNLLLVGITYDKETKKHICKIEKYK